MKITNRQVYHSHALLFPPSRIELESSDPSTYRQVWRRLNLPLIDSEMRETAFLLIHGKLSTRERLFRVNLLPDPYCTYCLDFEGLALIGDEKHLFCDCHLVHDVWNEFLLMLSRLCPGVVGLDKLDVLTLKFNGNEVEGEMVWLMAVYVNWIWKATNERGATRIKKEEFFGFLKFKYRECRGKIPIKEIKFLC